MATESSFAPAPTQSSPTPVLRQSLRNSRRTSVNYKFPVQATPPLSIQQSVRCSTNIHPNAKGWQHSGKYHPPPFKSYLSPAVREKPKKSEPVWHVAGHYQEKRPTSLSPELRPKTVEILPPWKPAGKSVPKPVPYFDPPSLRWSVQDLMRSMTLSISRSHSAPSARSRSATLTQRSQITKDESKPEE